MKLKSQKGSITIFVLIALLFYTAFLLLMYAANTNKFKTITEKSDILKGIYEKNISDESINNLYNKKKAEYNPNFSNFQKVEYLESTGTQYIDTGIKCLQTMSCEIENNFKELVGTQLFGAYSPPKRTHYGIVNNEVYMPTVQNSVTKEHTFRIDTGYHRYFLSSTVYKYDDEIIASGGFEFTNSLNFYLFARNNNESVTNYCKSKTTMAKFWNNNTLVRNFIPCYRKSDNKPGLYDLVENKFYTNQGTGEFIAGPEID